MTYGKPHGKTIHSDKLGTRFVNDSQNHYGKRDGMPGWRSNEKNIDEAWQFFDGRELPDINIQTTDGYGPGPHRKQYGHLLDNEKANRKGEK